jgi:hypothetical protein
VADQPRDVIIRDLYSDDPERISAALYSAAYHDPDWRWVQDECLRLLKHHDVGVRWTAATCLGDLALFHKTLDLPRVLPELFDACKDESIRDPAQMSISIIEQTVRPQ